MREGTGGIERLPFSSSQIAALARLMRVTSSLDGELLAGPLPRISALEAVNDNPASPYVGGPTTEIQVDSVLHAPGSLDSMNRS